MFPDAPYAPSRGSFTSPVLPPTVDPDASPNVSVTLACAWIPYVVGALQQLLLQATWKTDDPAVLLLAQQRAFNLIDLFMAAATASSGGCAQILIPFECSYDFQLSPFDWVAIPGFGSWTIVQGWNSNVTEDDAGACTKPFAIHSTLAGTLPTINQVHVVGSRQDNVGGAGSAIYLTVGGVQSFWGSLPTVAGPFDTVVSGPITANVQDIEIDLGSHIVPGPCSGTNPNNIALIEIFGSTPVLPCA